MEYMSTREAEAKWVPLTRRKIAMLCSRSLITGATKVSNRWRIPCDTLKPAESLYRRSIRNRRYEQLIDAFVQSKNSSLKAQNLKERIYQVRPFLKWVGGKGQLLHEIQRYYPFENAKREITRYAEPFVGGGAVLFDILSRYDIEEVYISDVNVELINCYLTIRNRVEDLIKILRDTQEKYLVLDINGRSDMFYSCRRRFNDLKLHGENDNSVEKAALFIFLNKTCFNGLYRVNSKGEFNSPAGRYTNPHICDEENLRLVSERLQKVNIVCGDYRKSIEFVDQNTFVYFDPPYRPLSHTSNFTSYTESMFNDDSQRDLANYVTELHGKGALIVVSNSDPHNENENDNFFETIYPERYIKRVTASRMINCKSSSRGKITELLISNFKPRC